MKIYIPNLSAISENFEGEIVGFSQKMGETQNILEKGWAYRFYWRPVSWGRAEEGKKQKWRTFLNQGMDERVEFLGSIIFISYVSVTGWRHLFALWDLGGKQPNLGEDIKVVCFVWRAKTFKLLISGFIYTKNMLCELSPRHSVEFISWKNL